MTDTDVMDAQRAAVHVDLEVDAARIDRAWSRVSGKLEQRPRYGMYAGLAVAAAAAALVGFWTWSQAAGPLEPTHTPLALEASDSSLRATLADGSSVVLGAGARLTEVQGHPDERAYRLEGGGATFDVSHDARRPFVVLAGAARVVVLGTRFIVEAPRSDQETRVRVAVERGRVAVFWDSERHVLDAGDEVLLGVGEELSPQTALDTLPDSEHSPTTREQASRRIRRARARVRARRAAEEVTSDNAATPAQRFADARRAATEGRLQDAVRGYEELLRRHPRDVRASLAAFELGRLRMDRLHEPRRALADLSRAIRMAPRSPLTDEARARRVRLYEQFGRLSACERARDEYLRRHPTGRHRADVESRCTPQR